MVGRIERRVASTLVISSLVAACGGRYRPKDDGAADHGAAGQGGGSTQDQPAPPELELSNLDSGSTLTAEPHQAITITLHTTGPGAYTTPRVSSDSVRFLGEVDPGLQNPGGPTQGYYFEADTAGTAVITIPHTVHPDPFEVTIVVD